MGFLSKLRPGKLAVRLAAYVILFSSAIAVVITAVELGTEYARDLRGIDSRMEQIKDAYLDSMVENVWVADKERIDILLLGITRLPDFVMAEVRIDGGTLLRQGNPLNEVGTTRAFPLRRMHRGQLQNIGELVVSASYENAYRRVLDRLVFFLAANGGKTLLVAIFIFFVFYRLVGRPIEQIARHVRDFNPERPYAPMNLSRAGAGTEDELHEVEDAYNQMAQRLSSYHEAVRYREEELSRLNVDLEVKSVEQRVTAEAIRLANASLEERVEQRTRELTQAKTDAESYLTHLRSAIEAISAGFVMFDADERLVLWNEAYRRISSKTAHLLVPGIKLEPLLRARVKAGEIANIEGDVEAWIQKRLWRYRNPGEPWEVVTDTGAVHLIQEQATRDGGRIILRTDITALKDNEKRMAELHAHLQGALESITAGVIIFDKNEKIVAFNDSFRKAVLPFSSRLRPGVSLEEWVSHISAQGHYGDVDPDFVAERIRKFRNLETVEFTERWSDDSEHLIMARHYRTPDGGTFIFREDVTAHKRIEERLRHAQKLEALGNLAGGVAHSLNNLLLPIMALSKLTVDGLPSASPSRPILEKVVEASLRAKDLVARVLAFSRQDAPRKALVDLRAVVNDAVRLARSSIPPIIHLESGIVAQPVPVMADTPQIEAVILNLVNNAVAAIGDRKDDHANGRLAVRLWIEPFGPSAKPGLSRIAPDGYAVIEVEDNGIGMNAATKARIFDPFFTTKKVGEGTGLGLSMAHGIVEEHGGMIEVDSTLSKGTSFLIHLPLASLVAEAVPAATEAESRAD